MDVKGKRAIVTGAASGIGKATAIAFGKAGAAVALVDVNREGAEKTAAQIEESGGRTLVCPTDLTRVAEVRAMVQKVRETFGRIDALANVAAIFPRSPVVEVTEEHWDQVLGLDLRGVFFCCQEAMRVMTAQGSGAIVNVASGAAFRAIEGLVAYSAAKGGLVSMSRVMALEGARKGVRVNVVAPGHTATEGAMANMGRERMAALAAQLVPGRWMEPQEIASAIVFLCSDAASGINGAILNVNGGNYMPA